MTAQGVSGWLVLGKRRDREGKGSIPAPADQGMDSSPVLSDQSLPHSENCPSNPVGVQKPSLIGTRTLRSLGPHRKFTGASSRGWVLGMGWGPAAGARHSGPRGVGTHGGQRDRERQTWSMWGVSGWEDRKPQLLPLDHLPPVLPGHPSGHTLICPLKTLTVAFSCSEIFRGPPWTFIQAP